MSELDLGRVTGKSAYEYAVEGGYAGTEAAFQALMGTGPWVPKAGFVPASNPNLLDNWYFGPGVIRQAGNTAATSDSIGKLVDRWGVRLFTAGSASVTDEGLHLVPGTYNGLPYCWIEQKSEAVAAKKLIPGQDMRLTVLLSDGNLISGHGVVPANWPDGTVSPFPQRQIDFQVDINTGNIQVLSFATFTWDTIGYLATRFSFRNEITVRAVKLETGTEQTLARRDASGGWVLNDPPPEPALELIKCMRYQQVLNAEGNNFHVFGSGVASTQDQVRIFYQMPVLMVNTPTLITSGAFTLLRNMAKPLIDVTAVNLTYNDSQSVWIRAFSDVVVGDWYSMHPNPDNIGKMILDANL